MVMYVDFMTGIFFLEVNVIYPLRLLNNFIYACCSKYFEDITSIS